MLRLKRLVIFSKGFDPWLKVLDVRDWAWSNNITIDDEVARDESCEDEIRFESDRVRSQKDEEIQSTKMVL